MGTSKAESADRANRIEEIQRQLGEREDNLHAEHVREWILQLAAERKTKQQPATKATKSVPKTPK